MSSGCYDRLYKTFSVTAWKADIYGRETLALALLDTAVRQYDGANYALPTGQAFSTRKKPSCKARGINL